MSETKAIDQFWKQVDAVTDEFSPLERKLESLPKTFSARILTPEEDRRSRLLTLFTEEELQALKEILFFVSSEDPDKQAVIDSLVEKVS